MPQLLSVNVGLPLEIDWKEAVRGRRKVGRLNIDGDGQGDLQGHSGGRLPKPTPMWTSLKAIGSENQARNARPDGRITRNKDEEDQACIRDPEVSEVNPITPDAVPPVQRHSHGKAMIEKNKRFHAS